jgi:hypothetical protein
MNGDITHGHRNVVAILIIVFIVLLLRRAF